MEEKEQALRKAKYEMESLLILQKSEREKAVRTSTDAAITKLLNEIEGSPEKIGHVVAHKNR